MGRHPNRKPSRDARNKQAHIRHCFLTLQQAWGPQHWWPAHTPFEVIIGAYLTQNTSWTNVEKALRGLRAAHLLSVAGIRRVPVAELEATIRSAGYFRQKAQRLKTFIAYLDRNYAASLRRMFAEATAKLREELLALNGIGPETADSILLYAGHHPSVVVDSYTRRLFERHQVLSARQTYDEARRMFEAALEPVASDDFPAKPLPKALPNSFRPMAHLPSAMSRAPKSRRAHVYSEMHGLIVQAGKHFCFKQAPDCEHCPLRDLLPASSPLRRRQTGRSGARQATAPRI